MNPDAGFDPMPERAYPYCAGLRAPGCAAFVFALLGGAGVALVPFGWEHLRTGKMPLGVALIVIGLFTAPMLLFALHTLFGGIRDTIRPPLLRVTSTALRLPLAPRGEPPQGDPGEARKDAPPPHPEELPFAAIRWIRRENKVNPGSDRLLLIHDLAPVTLVIEQYMMCRTDFDELETVLRAALPAAFSSTPPEQ